jgi:trehalose synthase
MQRHHRIHQIEDYGRFVGAETVERVRNKAEPLRGLRVAHVNSTYYGGGVAELLSSSTTPSRCR